MKESRIKYAVATIVIILATCTGLSCSSSRPGTGHIIDMIMEPYLLPAAPGAAILVMKDDSILVEKSYGMADLETGRPVTPTTNFRLASVTKEFTAMCIMLLAERGLLSYTDTLGRFFPDFPSYGTSITVRQLLNHTSGLQDYESLIPDSQTVQVLDSDCVALLKTTDSLLFSAGSKYSYSNTGYAFLAMIVEQVSGRRFADFLKENIFDPVGMHTTVAFEDGRSTVAERAFGYSLEHGKWARTDQSVTSAVLGDGGIYSNVGDMARWVSALFHHRLISPESQTAAWTAGTLNNGAAIDYGYGWHLETYRDIDHPYHGGSTIGFRNSIQLFPQQHLMIIILTNRDEGDPPHQQAQRIADLYLQQ